MSYGAFLIVNGGEGQFHTFCYRCPEFITDIPVTVGDIIEREGFWFTPRCSARTKSG